MLKRCLVTLICIAGLSTSASASRPELERSLDKCNQLLRGIGSRGTNYFSASSLIPLSQLLGTKYCQQIIKNHIEGEVHNKGFPTQGLAQMFLTAKTAADELIDALQINAIRPNYQSRDILQGAEETLRLIFEDQPEYIREAVLVRDGVVMVVPLLYRVETSKNGKPPLYIPVVVKGHQELEKFDILSAAFGAWALGEYLGRIPPKAYVHLKPMAKVRNNRRAKLEPDEMYVVNVKEQLPAVDLIHQEFLKTISDPEKLAEVKPRRCVQCNVCPWAAHCRRLMNANNDLSMMPYPPKEEVAERLGEIGLGTMAELAKLNVNSPLFIEAAVYAGVEPDRLRYWLAHARAKISDRPILIEAYEFPLADAQTIAHIDFEDALERNLVSGVYLFGTEVESKGKSRHKEFIFAESLDQKGVDEAWAEFIRFLRTHKTLKNKDFLISIYSPHEIVKFQQEFDMLIDDPDQFTPAQKRSAFYSEIEEKVRPIDPDQGDGLNEAKIKRQGRLIRNKDFFKKHKDISPEDVFEIMDRTVDLLEFTRWNFAFPTHSNGLKHILPYVSSATKDKIQYPDGWNGLESVAWAKSAYQSGEKSILEMIRAYNDIDIHSNFVVTQFLRLHTGKSVAKDLRFTEATEQLLDQMAYAAKARAAIDRLAAKDLLLENILGREILKLQEDELYELTDILDRKDYLEARKRIENSSKLSRKEKDQELQMLEHNNENTRKKRLMDFFNNARAYKKEPLTDETMDAIATLFLFHPTNYILPTHLFQIVAMSEMRKFANRQALTLRRTPQERLEVPENWGRLYDELLPRLNLKNIDTPVGRQNLRLLWDGLYFEKAFDGSRVRLPR